jgi:hypothetical protein
VSGHFVLRGRAPAWLAGGQNPFGTSRFLCLNCPGLGTNRGIFGCCPASREGRNPACIKGKWATASLRNRYCHAGGRGFESRRSRLRAYPSSRGCLRLPHRRMWSCSGPTRGATPALTAISAASGLLRGPGAALLSWAGGWCRWPPVPLLLPVPVFPSVVVGRGGRCLEFSGRGCWVRLSVRSMSVGMRVRRWRASLLGHGFRDVRSMR